MLGGLGEGPQRLEELIGVDLDVGHDEALLAQPGDDGVGVAEHRDAQQLPHGRGQTVGKASDRAEVQDTELAVGHRLVVAGVRVGVEESGADRSRHQEAEVERAEVVALLLRAVRDDLRQ